MEFDGNIEYLRLAFWQIIMTAGPVLGVALAIGLLGWRVTGRNIYQ
jgi:flagellar biosynthetic protein FliQ